MKRVSSRFRDDERPNWALSDSALRHTHCPVLVFFPSSQSHSPAVQFDFRIHGVYLHSQLYLEFAVRSVYRGKFSHGKCIKKTCHRMSHWEETSCPGRRPTDSSVAVKVLIKQKAEAKLGSCFCSLILSFTFWTLQ